LGWVVGEFYTLCDVTLQAFYSGFEEGLLAVVEVCERVLGLFGSGCLLRSQHEVLKDGGRELTPSSTGTEKKSKPVSLAIASPPGIPGR